MGSLFVMERRAPLAVWATLMIIGLLALYSFEIGLPQDEVSHETAGQIVDETHPMAVKAIEAMVYSKDDQIPEATHIEAPMPPPIVHKRKAAPMPPVPEDVTAGEEIETKPMRVQAPKRAVDHHFQSEEEREKELLKKAVESEDD